MPNSQKQQTVAQLEKDLANIQALFIAEYTGLDVASQQKLRAAVIQAGGYLKVTKNTLLKLALKNQGYPVDTIDQAFTNQNIFLFATDDPVAPLKVVADFAKDNDDKPLLKAGFLGKEALNSAQVKHLASLPSKQELLGKLVATIQAPLSGFVRVLSAPSRQLVYALQAIKDQANQ